MDKILFENGTLVTPAKVTINEVEYEVTPAEYTGETPFNAENLNQMQTNIENAINTLKTTILKTTFPIGSTYITQTNTNPATILEFGTWERVKGKVLVGLDENDEYFNAVGKEGGETKHTMTVNELVKHKHNLKTPTPYPAEGTGYWGINVFEGYGESPMLDLNGGETSEYGATQPFNIVQPYKVVGYMWMRTA